MLDVTNEDILRWLGDPGRYEIFLYFCMGLNYIPVTFNHIAPAFYTDIPHHQYKEFQNLSENSTTKIKEAKEYLDNRNTTASNSLTVFGDNASKEVQKNATIIEGNFICSQPTLPTSIYFLGAVLGCFLLHFIIELIGRKGIIMFTIHMQFIFGLALYFSENYTAFLTLIFFQGMLIYGLRQASFIYMTELLTTHRRVLLISLYEVFWSFSLMWLSLTAYLVKDWHNIQLAISIQSILIIIFNWFVPESLPWLLVVKKFKKARILLNTFSRIDKVPIPKSVTDNIQEIQVTNRIYVISDGKYSFVDLIKTPEMRRQTIIICYITFVCSLIYYGLTFGAISVAGNKYLNMFISGLVELPAYSSIFFILPRFGRKKSLAFYFFMCSITCIISGIISSQTERRYLVFSFSLVAKFSISASYAVAIFYTHELFPTVVRKIGIQICSFWIQVGAILAPQFLFYGKRNFQELFILGFGILSIIGGVTVFFLPETTNKSLFNTIDEVENMASQKKNKIVTKESEICLHNNEVFDSETTT